VLKSADPRARRFGVLALVAAMLFATLGARLWMLQVVAVDTLQEAVDETRMKTVRIPPERGRIFDAAGRALADNQRQLTVSLSWESMRVDTMRAELFARLRGWVEMSVEQMELRYDSGRFSRYLPMPVKEGVAESIAVALQERIEDFPGMSIDATWRRTYPYAPLASHVVGYTGAITAEDEDEYRSRGYDTAQDGELVGRSGLELTYEETLHGQSGEVVYEVDNANRIVRTVSERAPVDGMDLQVSIDLELQQYAERLLQTQLALRRQFTASNPLVTDPATGTVQRADPTRGRDVNYEAPAGSVVVMDHHSGRVAAMASYPTFDNRWFTADISDDKFDEVFATTDPDEAVLANRAIQGQYNVGSSFKPFVAHAALANGFVRADDEGTYTLRSISAELCATGVKCEYRNSTCPDGEPCVYGPIDLRQSLAVSSDAYYYRLGEEMYLRSRSVLQDHVRVFGYGVRSGIDLPFEFAGRIPDDDLKRRLIETGALAADESPTLLVGDEVNMVIGQGLLAATPLQLAVAYGAIANGDRVVTPTIVQAIYEPHSPITVAGTLDAAGASLVRAVGGDGRAVPMDPELREPIVAGLRQNVTGPGANGRSTTAEELFDIGYPDGAIPVAGKTGTAQGLSNYNWNDSSTFAAFSVDPS